MPHKDDIKAAFVGQAVMTEMLSVSIRRQIAVLLAASTQLTSLS